MLQSVITQDGGNIMKNFKLFGLALLATFSLSFNACGGGGAGGTGGVPGSADALLSADFLPSQVPYSTDCEFTMDIGNGYSGKYQLAANGKLKCEMDGVYPVLAMVDPTVKIIVSQATAIEDLYRLNESGALEQALIDVNLKLGKVTISKDGASCTNDYTFNLPWEIDTNSVSSYNEDFAIDIFNRQKDTDNCSSFIEDGIDDYGDVYQINISITEPDGSDSNISAKFSITKN